MGDSPLSGVTVIDLGQIYNAPYATLLMALNGADVIKVEPRTGENLRGRGRVAGANAPFVMMNSNKRGVTLNLKHPEGVCLLKEMIAKADVFVENFRPGVVESLGIGANTLKAINPSLIYASGSGYGSSGMYRDLAAMDITIQAMSGVMAVTGFPDREPVKAGPAIGDFMGGIHLYGAITTALYQREKTGVGSIVEVAMLDSVFPSLMSSLGLHFGGTGDTPTRTGNRHSGLAEAPYNVYPTTDGHVALICVSDSHWRALTHVMGRPELGSAPGLDSRVGRVQKIDEIDHLVTDWSKRLSKQEVTEALNAAGVPSAPVRELSEVVNDPHLHERGMLREIDHPDIGSIVVPHSPIRLGDFSMDIVPSPSLGQHNSEIYGDWLGLDSTKVKTLRERGVI